VKMDRQGCPSYGSGGKCQYIPNTFVPVHPEQPRATIFLKLIRKGVVP
jgi:hypothetical protein